MNTEQTSNAVPEVTKLKDTNLFHLGLIIVVGIVASTLPQPQVLGNLPLKYLLKQIVPHDAHQATVISGFFALCGLFWYIKPLAGILTDAFPLFGTRRRGYLLASSVGAAISWIAVSFVPHTYNALLAGAIIVNLFMVMMSTVIGAFLVEAGQKLQATGRLTSVRFVAQNSCIFANGYFGGILAKITTHGGFQWTPISCAMIVLTIFPVAYVFLRESQIRVSSKDAFRAAGIQTRNVMAAPPLWFALVFVFLYYFAPGFGTVQFLKQSGEMKLDPEFIAHLGIWSGAAGMVAAFLYGFLVKRFNIKLLLVLAIALNASLTLLYWFYNSATLAIIIDTQNGFFGGFCEVVILDLAARSTPIGSEGLGYGLILSIRNFAIYGADYLGSRLHDDLHFDWSTLVGLNAGATAIVLILVPFLPKSLMHSKDGPAPSSEGGTAA